MLHSRLLMAIMSIERSILHQILLSLHQCAPYVFPYLSMHIFDQEQELWCMCDFQMCFQLCRKTGACFERMS